MGGKDTSGRTGPDGSPLSPAVDLSGRERKRWLFAGSADSIDFSGGAAVLIGDAGTGEAALLVDTALLVSVKSATHVTDVRREKAETVSAPMAGAQIIPRAARPTAPTCGTGTLGRPGPPSWLSGTGRTPVGPRTWTPRTADGQLSVLGRGTTLTPSRDLWLVLWGRAGTSAYRKPILPYRATMGRASRSARAIAADPDSYGPQSDNRGT
jgi:hypothetical protein